MKIALTPKHDFLSDKLRASTHQDVVASPQFKSAAQLALLEMQFRSGFTNIGEASINYIKLKGAQEFLTILINLGEPDEPRRNHTQESLNPV
jgi:hypothetical protein